MYQLETKYSFYTLTLKTLHECFEHLMSPGYLAAQEASNPIANVATQVLTILAHGCTASDEFVKRLSSSNPSHWAPLTISPVVLAAKLSTLISSGMTQLPLAASTLLAVLVEDNTSAASLVKSEEVLTALKLAVTTAQGIATSTITRTPQTISMTKFFCVEMCNAIFSIHAPAAAESWWLEAVSLPLQSDLIETGHVLMVSLEKTKSKDKQEGETVEGMEEETSEDKNAAFQAEGEEEEMKVDADEEDAFVLGQGEKLLKEDSSSKLARRQQDAMDMWVRDINCSRQSLEVLLSVYEELESQNKRGGKKESSVSIAARTALENSQVAKVLFSKLQSMNASLRGIVKSLSQLACLDEIQLLVGLYTPLCHLLAVVIDSNNSFKEMMRETSSFLTCLHSSSAALLILDDILTDTMSDTHKAPIVSTVIEFAESAIRLSAECVAVPAEKGIISANQPNFDQTAFLNEVLAVNTQLLTVLQTSSLPLKLSSIEDSSRFNSSWASTRAMSVSLLSQIAQIVSQPTLVAAAPVLVSVLVEESRKGAAEASALVLAEVLDMLFERFGDEQNDALLKQLNLVEALTKTSACGREMMMMSRMQQGWETEGLDRLKQEIMPNLVEFIKYKKSHGC
eukprot:GDKJ01035839.1.p1 GENE.GDKJ01035839.1~~GDKJ01035839.1.p1  ORF type:complete len:714 (+),score=182.98 GDKJ01035839.1:269-2143(+)